MRRFVERAAPADVPSSIPDLRVARFDDYAGIAALAKAQSWQILTPEDWRALWLENPLWPKIGKDWPIGWVLDAGDEIVGSILNVPYGYVFRGRELVCGTTRGWSSVPAYRGYALGLIDEYCNQPTADLLVSTTANEMAAPVVERILTRVPLGAWDVASFWVTDHVDFARRKLQLRGVPGAGALAYPAGGAMWLRDLLRSRALPPAPRDIDVAIVDGFDERFDVFWRELVRRNPDVLLADRSLAALRWHYRIALLRSQLSIVTASRRGTLLAYCVVNRKVGGPRAQIADYQTIESGVDLLPGLLRAALRSQACQGVYSLQLFGLWVPKMRAFDTYAPHRERLSNWRFFYRAADRALGDQLREPACWDPSAYDGDASFV
ncbi:MAG TPA: hypothetical protein VEJ20_10160 [Candidatus Eremiobacteraceae bacterium]|nr:hypothetical protein [Candidatus Eremiobacteraceae bacterium]